MNNSLVSTLFYDSYYINTNKQKYFIFNYNIHYNYRTNIYTISILREIM